MKRDSPKSTSSFASLAQHLFPRLSKSTRKSYLCMQKHLLAFCNGTPPRIGEINEAFLFNFADYLLLRVKPQSARVYLEKLYALLRVALKGSRRLQCLPALSELLPRYVCESHGALTLAELQRMKEARCPHKDTKQAFLFSCYTGLRLSDIKSLCWNDIKCHANGLYIEKRQKKTLELAVIPLGTNALHYLPDRPAGARPEDRVFPLMSDSTIRNDLRAWGEEAGVAQAVTFHVSRHTFATHLIESKCDIFIASKLCGHSSVRITERYVHLSFDQRSLAIHRLDTYHATHGGREGFGVCGGSPPLFCSPLSLLGTSALPAASLKTATGCLHPWPTCSPVSNR